MLLPSADTESFVTVLPAGHARAVPLGRDYCMLLLQTWAANPAVIIHWQVPGHRNSNGYEWHWLILSVDKPSAIFLFFDSASMLAKNNLLIFRVPFQAGETMLLWDPVLTWVD